MNAGGCCGTGCWHNHNAIWVDHGEVPHVAAVAQGSAGIQGGAQPLRHDDPLPPMQD
jgi:hypothetical protein